MNAPVLYWPKLFEGLVLGVGNYTARGSGSAIGYGHQLPGNGGSTGGYYTGSGDGGEYADNIHGDGWGDGNGWNFGDANGDNKKEEYNEY